MKAKHRRWIITCYAAITYLIALWITFEGLAGLSVPDPDKLLVYFLLLIFVQSHPIRIDSIRLTLANAVLIPVFLEYGLMIQLWVYQISGLIALLIGRKIPWYRELYNGSSYIWMSIIPSWVYTLLGGTIRPISIGLTELFSISAFTITSFLLHGFFVLIYYFNKRHHLIYQKDYFQWSLVTLLLAFPLGVLYYTVDLQTGSFGVWMMAVPVLSISYILRLYYELRHASYQLKSLNDVSMSFTSELDLEKTMQSILLGLREMVSYDRAILYLRDWESNVLYPYLTDPSSCDPEEDVQAQIPMGIGIVGEAALLQKSRLIQRKNMIISLDREPEMVAENASMLVVPIVFEEQVYGVILLGSQSEYHFHERDLNLVRIMATQAAVAIKNALRFRKTERRSQVDELTGLYNYRYFDRMLNRMVEEAASKQEPLSLLVIDIDYFKRINDTFGHLVGNEALVAVAGTIKANVRKKDIVSRYGGEEFTVLLPNTTSEEAMEIAERIRKQVGRTHFKAGSSINRNENVYLTFTVSIGIATYPDQADSAQSLVRHADRAMYVGSKQQGRNRVAVYGA